MLRGDESIAELALAVGAVGFSFDAEVFCGGSHFPGNLAAGNNKRKHGAMVYRQ